MSGATSTGSNAAAASMQKRAGVPSQLANLQQQLKDAVVASMENFTELVKLADLDNQTSLLSSLALVQLDHLELQVEFMALLGQYCI